MMMISGGARADGAKLTPEREKEAVAAYRKLAAADIDKARVASLPGGLQTVRVDVSEKMRSASFGHTTALLVPVKGNEFYVEYGRSTNKPGGLFGPFTIH